jgi:hypothetical protein
MLMVRLVSNASVVGHFHTPLLSSESVKRAKSAQIIANKYPSESTIPLWAHNAIWRIEPYLPRAEFRGWSG